MPFDGVPPRSEGRAVAQKRKPKAEVDGDAAVAEALMKDYAKARKAIAETEFRKFEAAAVEWLMSSVNDLSPDRDGRRLGYSSFRERFPHRVSKATPETLSKIKALIGLLVEAFEENDGEGLEQAAGFLDLFLGLKDKAGRIKRGISLVGHAVKSLGDPAAHVEVRLPFLLTVVDPRFGRLSPEQVRAVLSSVKPQIKRAEDHVSKGGKHNVGHAGALAKLATLVGALDVKSEAAAKKMILNALSDKSPAKRRRRHGLATVDR